jgi:tetratricopeptide (TPR) repeat protein
MDLFRIARSYADRRYALIAIVISYVDEGKYDKALSILDKSITMAREENATADLAAQEQLRAYLLLEFGRLEEAKQAFQRAKMLAEQSELSEEIKDYARQRFFYGKARLAIADKDLATADSALQNFRQEGENNENPDMIRAAHELAGMIAKARGDFQQALTEFAHANQQDPYTFYRIAEVHLELGNKEEALKYFSRAAKFNALNSLNYALIRQSAERRVLDLKKELSRPLSLQLQSVG